jgi:hypothetical protein
MTKAQVSRLWPVVWAFVSVAAGPFVAVRTAVNGPVLVDQFVETATARVPLIGPSGVCTV